ncbi:MAG: glycosyltransferase family 4 protein [Candidatus Fermentibacter sp.]|nr:glycosyltransferase family 4 protein [Candidatus Fermentibacter sp.]
MRTCFMLKNRLRGDARVKKEALALKAAGWDVTVLCWEEPGAPREEDWNGISVRRLRFRSAAAASITDSLDSEPHPRGPLRAALSRLRHSRARRRAADFFRNAVFDVRLLASALRTGACVVHAHDLDTLMPARAAALLLGARLVYDSHELWLGSARYLRETGAVGRLRDRLAERLLIRRADAVIAVTRGRIGVMEEMYPGIRIELVENCPEAIPELPPRGRLDGVPEDGGPIVLYQGAIAYERGLEKLIEACGLLPAGSVRVVMIGPDATSGVLPAMARERDVNGVLSILPPVPSEKLPGVTASADIGLILFQNTCPNHYYSLPNKLYEYMMAGLPIIASDLPEMADLICRERCGMLIDPESPRAIARGILGLASDGAARAEMGGNGRAAALARYTWPAQAAVLTGIYGRFAGCGARGGGR